MYSPIRNFLNYFSPFVLLGSFIFGLLLFGSFLASVWLLKPSPQPPPPGTALIYVIPASTATPVTSLALPTATPTPTRVPVSGPPISLGAYVQISGTGLDGLRIRSEPGLQAQIRFVAIEAEVFHVIDGPRELDGYSWWLLQAPYDTNVQGWAVSEYLSVIQQTP
jgi:hypothetical protein